MSDFATFERDLLQRISANLGLSYEELVVQDFRTSDEVRERYRLHAAYHETRMKPFRDAVQRRFVEPFFRAYRFQRDYAYAQRRVLALYERYL